MIESNEAGSPRRRAVLLIAKAAIAAAPVRDMERLRGIVAALPGIDHVAVAFVEQGAPSLRMALATLGAAPVDEIHLVPLVLPMEPSFPGAVAKAVARWQKDVTTPTPLIRLGEGPTDSAQCAALLRDLVARAAAAPPLTAPSAKADAGSVVTTAKRRVLVCDGTPCHEAGASAVWSHLRAEQTRLALRTAGDGTMTTRTTCLGPCNLAPVVQVWPEGTFYGGMDEAAIDRVIAEHLLGGRPVEAFAYGPGAEKQRLRPRE